MKPADVYYKALNMTLMESAIATDDEIRERRATISENPKLTRRLGTLALHRAVQLMGPDRVRETLELPYRRAGIQVLGHGYTATAIREGEEGDVRKIIRGSNRLSAVGRINLARTIEEEIAISNTFHPDIAVPTIVTIDASPILKKPTVQLIQPFVPSIAERADPREVIDFAEKSLEEMMPVGYLPDVKGSRNLFNTADGIRLVDTVPIPAEDARTYGLCAVRLYEMASTGR